MGADRCAAPRGAAGEAAPRPYTGWVADQRWTLDLPRWSGAAPLCRGQAVPDPPAHQGRQSHGAPIIPVPAKSCTWSTHATAICRAAGAVGGAEFPGRVPAGQGSAERPILSGGRRCLTPRPATAGKPDRGRSNCHGLVIHTGTFAGVHVATLPGAAPVDRSRVFLAPRAHRPVPTASPCRLLTASPLGEPRRLSG
jgi:hypothetical protein